MTDQKVTCESLVAAGWIDRGKAWTKTIGEVELSVWLIDGRWFTDGGLDDVLIPATSMTVLAEIESSWCAGGGIEQ